MSTLLYALGRWSFRRPWKVLVTWVLLLVLAGGGAALFSQGTDNSFSIPGTEAQEGLEELNRTFPQVSGTSAQLVVVAADGDRIDDDAYRGAINDAVADFSDLDDVIAVTDPYDDTISGLLSDDGTAAIIRMQFEGQATEISDETVASAEAIADDLAESLPAGSQAALGGDLFSTAVPTLTIIEAIGVLIALFVLMITFRSIAVAWFPLISAIIGVGLAVALIFVATVFTTISSTTPLLAVMLGLAVGIDYSLFIVARHQDQVRAGMEPEESAARATGTAGSAVVFAGVTVLIALIGLSFAGIPFLTTMGIAAAVAVAIAVVVALTLTPALLGFAGGRVIGWKRRKAPRSLRADGTKRPNRWVMLVTRRPLVTTIAVVAALGAAAIPAASLTLALPNAGMQSEESEARQAYDLVAEKFGPGANGPLIMTGTIVTSTDPLGLMDDLAAEIEQVPGVAEVALATPNETADTGIIQIIPETAPDDPATADLVRELRAQHDRLLDEYGVDLKVTGFTAVAIDISDRLGEALLPFGIFVVGLSLILLMIVFRSIWVPLKAAAGYLLSVATGFGAVAAVFEWGWFADLLHVSRTGPVISFMPIILMGVLFGLAMDYEVFLVSRMREDYVHARRRLGRTPTREELREIAVGAVRSGFTASARVVTAAAVIMFAVFAAFVPEGDTSIKPIALGLAVGIAVDAFLVRMTLVPAVMTLLGDRAWWFPKVLDRMLPHFDIEGEAVEREIALEDWPERDTTAAVVAEDVGVAYAGDRREGVVYSGASFRLEAGSTLIVTSDDARAARGLLLTIAGRLAPTQGRIKVEGHLLPERSAWVRPRVGVALLHNNDDPAGELREAFDGGSRVVVVDALDSIETQSLAARDQSLEVLRRSGEVTLIVSASDAAFAERALVDAGRSAVTVLSVSGPPAASVLSRSSRSSRSDDAASSTSPFDEVFS
ncbi:MMPL family transporter [Microbacterium kunmingense]|uniref:MMPL family transporter n=1 Tax=Microbacterium kunmingense TaxID=2915939 RepID=UPI0020055249|nr:MMPL family transporter [Microbacterium kunmingense]